MRDMSGTCRGHVAVDCQRQRSESPSDQLMGTPQKTGPKDKGGAGSDDSLGQMIIDQIVGFGI